MASIILVYGSVFAILSFAIQQIASASAKAIVLTGIVGGGLCVLWGIVALAGHKRRAWAVLTMVAVGFVTLSQVVQAWLAATDATSISLTGRLVLTLMLLMTVSMLIYVLHGERSPEFYDPGASRRDNSASRGERAQTPETRHRP